MQHLVVVQRSEVAVHARLTERLGTEGVPVIWDRRQAERRTVAAPARSDRRRRDRRHRERRQPPPLTWATLGFLMVPRTDAPQAETERS